MSTGYSARHRSASTSSRPPPLRSTTPIDTRTNNLEFDPCASTAYTFLFAQGSSIICLHHDTLALDRKFDLHKEPILILSVDVISDRGAGRYVVSYDAGMTAIVWDVTNGNEIARFASYEPIKVAAWMKNGNVAFGKCGSIFSSFMINWLILVKATRRATLFCSSLERLSTSLHEQSSTQLPPLPLRGTVKHTRLGE